MGKFARESSWAGRQSSELKYSSATLKLTQQHLLERHGRWGEQATEPKGFDRHLLEDLFNRPMLVTSRSGTAQLGFFDDFSMPNFGGRPKPAELVGDVENLAGFSDEEMLALKICSVSEEAPCRAAK